MPKNIEDIIIPEKSLNRKSIRNIPIPENRVRAEAPPRERRTSNEFVFKRKTDYFKSPLKPRKFIIGATAVGIILVIFSLLSIFKSATLTYTPKIYNLTFNKDSFIAYKTGGANDLLFSVIKLSGTKGVDAKASGEENVSIKASGQAIVYNTTTSAVKLVQNTRFATPDGKIFRILANISIPAKIGSVPGSIEVNLYADQAGTDYNIGLSDFTVPGLKGDPKYSAVYARSKAPMIGGFVGTRKKVSDVDLAKAKTTLETGLKNDLLIQAKAQVPADFILYPGLIVINYADLPQTTPTTDAVTINESADFYGVMFKRNDLNNYLSIKKADPSFVGPVELADLESLTANLQKQSTTDFLKTDQISFDLTGSSRAVAVTLEDNLKKDLVGIPKSDLNAILSKYPSIGSASIDIKPFWKNTFPTNPNDIRIVERPLN